MRIEYDDEVDAIYVYAREGFSVARSEILEDGRVVDLDASSRGVHLGDLAERFGMHDGRPGLEALERLFRSTEPA